MGDKKQTLFKHVPCEICGKDDFERLGRPKMSMKFASLLDGLERCIYSEM
jgi:hypothetical protein